MNTIDTTAETTRTVTVDASAAITLGTQAQVMLNGANGIVIDSQELYEIAGEDLRRVKALQKQVEEKRTAITGPLNAATKAVNDLFRSPKEYLDQAEAVLKRAITGWTVKQEQLAAEARAKAEAEARAERERLAEEQRKQEAAAAAAMQAAQEAAAAGDAEAAARAQAEAQALEMQAQASAATAAVVTIAPTVAAPVAAAGISKRVTYSAEVTDLLALVKAVAEGKAPIEVVQADAKFLGAQARAFKKQGELYPGVQSVATASVAARAA